MDVHDLYVSGREASISGECPLKSTTLSTQVRRGKVLYIQHSTHWRRVSHADTVHFNICHGVFGYACVSMCVRACAREWEPFSTHLPWCCSFHRSLDLSINKTTSFGLADRTCNGVCITSLTDWPTVCTLDWLFYLTGRAWNSRITFYLEPDNKRGELHKNCRCAGTPVYIFSPASSGVTVCLFRCMHRHVCASWWHEKRWGVRTINLHSVIYKGGCFRIGLQFKELFPFVTLPVSL